METNPYPFGSCVWVWVSKNQPTAQVFLASLAQPPAKETRSRNTPPPLLHYVQNHVFNKSIEIYKTVDSRNPDSFLLYIAESSQKHGKPPVTKCDANLFH